MRRGVILRWLAEGVIIRLVAATMLLSLAAGGPARAGRETISIPVTEPQPATITGDLYTPSGKGPYPAVVLFHGCGGVTPNVPAWAQRLQSDGYAIAKGGKGATVEYNPKAHEDSEKQVKQFLAAQLRP